MSRIQFLLVTADGLSVFGLVMGGLLLAYFGIQIVASVAVIPVRRRLLSPMEQILRLSVGPAASA